MLDLFPPIIREYLQEVERKTGRKVGIETVPDLGIGGMKAGITLNPSVIQISLIQGSKLEDPEVQRALAHEATHYLLVYHEGFSYVAPTRPLVGNEGNLFRLIGTMVDDIVVNKLLEERGISPFSSVYFTMTEKETRAARKDLDIYKQFNNDSFFKRRFMVYRYIQAWACLQYYTLEQRSRKILEKFTNAFEMDYPIQFEMAMDIQNIIKANNVFSAVGHRFILERVIELWRLDGAVELRTENLTQDSTPGQL